MGPAVSTIFFSQVLFFDRVAHLFLVRFNSSDIAQMFVCASWIEIVFVKC